MDVDMVFVRAVGLEVLHVVDLHVVDLLDLLHLDVF